MRIFIATLLLLFAVFGIPDVGTKPTPDPVVVTPKIRVAEPSQEMKDAVAGIASAMKDASIADRMTWAQVWAKAGMAVKADSTDTKVVWGDTNKLRQFTETALRIGWRRISGNHKGKYEDLRAAVEVAFNKILSLRNQNVTPELREKYVALCDAVAWAGIGRDQ